MKKILATFIILIAGLLLVACDGDAEIDLHDQVFDSVSIIYQQGDSSVAVTKNITLPITTSISGVTLNWVSSNPTVIDVYGNVTRPSGSNATVILVLQVTINGETKEKPFTLNVLQSGSNPDPNPNPNQFTVSFNSDGGSAVSSLSINSGAKITPPTQPTKTGFTFGGWYKDTNLDQAWNFNVDTVTSNITLYAKWNTPSSQVPAGYIAIGSKEEFMAMTDYTKKYMLTADIDFGGTEAKPLGAWGSVDWTGEKNPAGIFKGEFDGNGYALMNFTLTGSQHPGLIEEGLSFGTSLFPNLTGKVRNLNIINATIVGDGFSGGVAGLIEGGSVTNVYFQGSVTSSKSWGSAENMAVPAGGIAGMLGGGVSQVSNVFVDADVTGGHIFFGYAFANASNLIAVQETLSVDVTLQTGQEKDADTPYLVKSFTNAEVIAKASLSGLSFGIKWSTTGSTRPYLIRVDGGVPAWALV